ncbi:MAG: protein translocase subunit SecF [Spirochaetaceae bacterium 4572_7]|nr:MAG: protein translocase subunit SecF [Spirochaetaceae bacterium 4572_7]
MKKNFNFTKYKSLGFFSVGLIVVGFIYTFAVNGGFNLGIDFNPGINQQIKIESSEIVERGVVLDSLENIKGVQVQVVGSKDENRFVIKVQDSGEDNFQSTMTANIKTSLDSSFGAGSITVLSTEFIGGSFSADLTNDVIFLTFFALLLILAYVWIRFHLNYAFSAIAAIFHDVLFLLAFIGVTGLEVNTGTIAAVLTIIGYSLNDTIVIFDRVRENVKSLKGAFEEKVNISLNESLSRTIITSLTTLIAVSFIFVFADGQIKDFALSLIVGILVGTYSSIFVASSVVVVWSNVSSKKQSSNIKSI